MIAIEHHDFIVMTIRFALVAGGGNDDRGAYAYSRLHFKSTCVSDSSIVICKVNFGKFYSVIILPIQRDSSLSNTIDSVCWLQSNTIDNSLTPSTGLCMFMDEGRSVQQYD
jgi:hypothetical protein